MSSKNSIRLRSLPEVGCRPVPPCCHGVSTPSTLQAGAPYLQGCGKDRTLGRGANVSIAADPKDNWAEEEDDGWESIREPEANIFLRVSHSDLPNQGSDIDKQIEPHVNPRSGVCRVDNDALAVLQCLHTESGDLVLFGDEWRDTRLECPSCIKCKTTR